MPEQPLPHRRRNALTGEFVQVSPHRMQRPWQGSREHMSAPQAQQYDPQCHLCPGNERAGGHRNPRYGGTYCFANDFPALLPDTSGRGHTNALLHSEPARGYCEVICFSPLHNLSLARLPESNVLQVIATWSEVVGRLSSDYPWVQIFENKGAMMGCSSAHPHGQVWALDALPNEALKEDAQQRAHWREHGSPLLLDYAELEFAEGERVVDSNADWLLVVPYWASWPFETLLLPRFAVQRLDQLTHAQQRSLAAILQRLLRRYDNLFETDFPYSMGWHGAPGAGSDNPHWQLHAHWYPPLLRSASVRKFMVGYEMLAEPQRDLTPEAAAAQLREVCGERHYLER
ncbi:MAG: UDP-glucose--hexose-1-phosphate uridylyltransferase [Halioglobus sp.]|nr:UDP-glucose--hexose-1-phosphate uridylyltransferase [Halioglobus sp.]